MTMLGNNTYESVIKLELLQVHNWGLFEHPDPISLNDNNLFFGDNGTGKTMSMDAITYLLYGNNRFNVSSEKKGGDGKPRNVLSMILGTINSEEQANLREVGTISYIIVQGYDNAEHAHFVLGVCLESIDTDRYTAYRFVLRNTKLNQVYYCERKANDTIRLLKHNEIKVIDPDNPLKQGEKIQFYNDTNSGVRQFLSVLGMAKTNPKLVVSKINQALSYSVKSDLDQFIRENILTEASMMAALDQIRDEQQKHSDQLARLDVLKEQKQWIGEILDLHSLWLKAKKKDMMVDLCNLYSNYKYAESEEQKKIEARKREKHIFETETEKEKFAAKQETEALNELRRAETALSRTDKERMDDIEKQLVDVKEGLAKSAANVNRLIEVAKKIRGVLETLTEDEKAADPRVQTAIETAPKIGTGVLSVSEIHDFFTSFEEWKEEMMEAAYKERLGLSSEIDGYKKDLREMSIRLETMKAGNTMDYPSQYVEAKRAVTEEFKNHGISESESHVRFFAETVESIDPEWQRAIELYLGDRRYHLIVPDKYNMGAFATICRKNIYNAAIPYDSNSGKSAPVVMDDSAAKMLTISNREARAYADYLLGRVKLCKDDTEMRQALKDGYVGAITKDGAIARGRSRYLNDIKSKKVKLFIGAEAVQKAIESLEKEMADLREIISDEENKRVRATQKYERLKTIPSIASGEYDFNAEQYVERYTIMCDRLTKALEQFQQENAPVFAMIQEAKVRYDNNKEEHTQIIKNVERARANMENLDREINECHEATKKARDVFDEKERESGFDSVVDEVNTWYEGRLRRGDEYPQRDKNVSSSSVYAAEDNLKGKQREYRNKFGLGEIDLVGTSAIHTYYRKRYDQLDKTDIEKGKNDLRQIEEKVTHTFCSNFIVQIYNMIQSAKKEIHDINRFLASRNFGSQTYKIECHERTDDNFGTFMSIVEALNINYGMNSADDSNLDENAKENLLHLMNYILEDENVMMYADYRNYLETDISIEEVLRDGKTRHFKLSKKNATASNGEKATPFLIIMVLSMYSILKDNKFGYRSFFMDEAFSVYSADRITQMMQLLKDLGFQSFFAGPDSSKAKYMENVALINTYKPAGATYSLYIDSFEKKIAGGGVMND